MSSRHPPPPPAAGKAKPPGRSPSDYNRFNPKKDTKVVYRVKETKSDKVVTAEESPPPPASEKSQSPESSSSRHRYNSEEKTESVDIVKETKSDKVVSTEESSPPPPSLTPPASGKYQSPKGSSSQKITESVNIVKEVNPDKVVKTEENSDQQRNDANVRTKDFGFWYDICPPIVGPKLKPSLHVGKKEMREDENRTISIETPRPGMVLLRQFLSLKEQVRVIRKCRELGIGPGGFYQPGYADGAKLRLKMMCLGKNWDPETGKYGETRACDGSKAPPVPEEFLDLVRRAINDSHLHLVKNNVKRTNVERVLPSMKPDLCIVNFYSTTGQLGLHQDKDESPESLQKGLPVVSLSIGDSAEFLHGDSRNVDEAEKVVLKSGDVLIFGGKSRHVFHGVPTVSPNSAPKYLSADTNIRPGRLNLTFRQY